MIRIFKHLDLYTTSVIRNLKRIDLNDKRPPPTVQVLSLTDRVGADAAETQELRSALMDMQQLSAEHALGALWGLNAASDSSLYFVCLCL